MNPWTPTRSGTGKFNRSFFELRDKRGWTQEQMGKVLGYNAHTVCRIENGISGGKLDLWQKVKEEFQIPAEAMWDLMTGNETMYKYNAAVAEHAFERGYQEGKKAAEDERNTEEI